MFCPNCGTKNEEVAEKCAQCGFDLQVKKAAPKFKGTMMMQASPFAGATPGSTTSTPDSPAAPASPATPAPAAPSASEVSSSSPPPTGSERPVAAPAGARPALSMKGTMVGLAPPGMEELRRKLAEASKPSPTATTAAAEPTVALPKVGASPTAQPSAGPTPSSKLKGTMIGVAPPSVADLRKAAGEGATGAPSAVPVAAPAAAAARPASSAQLKGTMIGVAPPSVADLRKAADDAAGRAPSVAAVAPAAASAAAASRAASSKLKGTMIGVAPPDAASLRPRQESNSGAADPLGGTMVGTSPFHGLDNAEAEASAASALMARSAVESATEPAPPFDASDATPAEGMRSASDRPADRSSDRATERASSEHPAAYRPVQPVAGVPTRSNAPVILLIGVILVICLVLAAFVI